jgi:hypothetical protein
MMNKFLDKIPLDKKYHIIAGFNIVTSLGHVMPVWQAFIASGVVGLLKEVWDYFHPQTHTCDGKDFHATAVGGLIGAIYLLLAKLLLAPLLLLISNILSQYWA